jgi:hypothetical protein
MTWPSSDVSTTAMDGGTDTPPRAEFKSWADKFNEMRNHVSTLAQTILNRNTAALMRADLGVAPRATRIDVASAGTVDLTASAPDCDDIRITGTTTITDFTIAAGRVVRVTFDNALTLTNGSPIVTQTGANTLTEAGATCVLRATAANVVEVLFWTPATAFVRSASTKTLLQPNDHAIGYGAGSGGAITQLTSKSTNVELDKPAGQITTHSAALAAGATVYFYCTGLSPRVGATDVVNVCIGDSSDSVYQVWVARVYVGGFQVGLRNNSASSLSQAVKINFAVLRASTS